MGLTTLKERRKRGDMIETYKTMNGFNRVKIKKLVHPNTGGRKRDEEDDERDDGESGEKDAHS